MVGADTIRMAIVENARAADPRGVNIDLSELGRTACPRRGWRTDSGRAVPNSQGVENGQSPRGSA